MLILLDPIAILWLQNFYYLIFSNIDALKDAIIVLQCLNLHYIVNTKETVSNNISSFL